MSTLGVIGLGLIGGSLALDLKRRGFAQTVLGVEKDSVAAQAALTIGLADEIVPLETCVQKADILVVAVPVSAAVKLVPEILDGIGPEQLVIDVCSTKSQICHAVKYHADAEESAPKAVKTIEQMYGVLNMRPIYMNAEQHDLHTAYVSHISHVTSFALALTVLDKEKDEKHIFDLASGGFASTVRLAKSSADMWVPILTQNHDNVLHVMDTYIEKMQQFRDAIATYDEDKIRELIAEANRIKRIIR